MDQIRTLDSDFDIAVIGTGVVGCAMARRYALAGARVVVVEKALEVLDGASKANSAILHTGFDAPPGSLEQACIAEGYKEFMRIRDELGLPLLRTGALVLAWNDEQCGQLDALIDKAHANGVTDVTRLSRDQLLVKEPSLSGQVREGFEIPGEFVIDPWSTPHAYLLQAIGHGAQLYRNAEVLSGDFDGQRWNLHTAKGHLRAQTVINCAGLFGDRVNELLIGEKLFSITPRKGQFVVFDKQASRYVKHTILPVPTGKTKGVVVCRTIFGNVLVGPTAEDQHSRDDDSTDAQALKELHRQGAEIVPALADCEVTACYAGLRPATEYSDYQIYQNSDKRYICVGGIRSTGLSAALGIASYVEKMTTGMFSAQPVKTAAIPEPSRLSDYHTRDWQLPDNGGIVCHCEWVTQREIERVLKGPLAPVSLAGLKRQTRVCMGRCQGFYCQAKLAELTRQHFDSAMVLADEI